MLWKAYDDVTVLNNFVIDDCYWKCIGKLPLPFLSGRFLNNALFLSGKRSALGTIQYLCFAKHRVFLLLIWTTSFSVTQRYMILPGWFRGLGFLTKVFFNETQFSEFIWGHRKTAVATHRHRNVYFLNSKLFCY